MILSLRLPVLSFLLSCFTSFALAAPYSNLLPEELPALEARQTFSPPRQIAAAGFEFIDPQSYFAISGRCKTDTRLGDQKKFGNRFNYYKQAIKDATQIAQGAQKWPQLGTDASKLYMYQDLDQELAKPYVANITKNIKEAANWERPQWGWDAYITLTCDDPSSKCGNKIGVGQGSFACYVNNTMNLWSTVSRISCCNPYFTLQDNQGAFNYALGKDTHKLGLNWMRTSGSYLVLEMMHTKKITQVRPHIADKQFDGSEKYIYGPVLCAKAAKQQGFIDETTGNADSYAEFMLAMYWKDLFDGVLLQPKSSLALTEAPPWFNQTTDDIQMSSDNDDNYIDFSAQVTKPSLTCAGSPSDNPSTSQAWVSSKVDDYCKQTVDAGWIVNSTLGRYGPKEYAAGANAPDSNNDLWISVSHDPGCDPNTMYAVELDVCTQALGMAVNGCNTDSTDQKWGGQVEMNCALWNITTRTGHDVTPPNGLPATIQEFPNG